MKKNFNRPACTGYLILVYVLTKVDVMLAADVISYGAHVQRDQVNETLEVRKCPFPNKKTGPRSCFDRPSYPSTILALGDIRDRCSLNLDDKTQEHIGKAIALGARIIVFVVEFSNLNMSKCYQKTDVFNYHAWTWVYSGPNGLYPFIKGPYDQDILSTGLLYLDRHIVQVNFTLSNPNCTMVLGSDGTNQDITRILHKAIQKYQRHLNVDKTDQNSAFCYPSYLNDSGQIPYFQYYLQHMLFEFNRTDRYYTGLYCCNIRKHSVENGTNESLKCDKLETVTRWVFAMQCVGFILYCFSPLLLRYFGSSPSDTIKSEVPSVPLRDDETDSYIDLLRENDSEMWISDNTVVTGNICSFLFNACGRRHWMIKIRRAVLFLFIIPSVSITKVLVYSYLKYKFELLYRYRFDIPLGILAIPLGFKAAAYNWKCFLGGPYVVFGIYVTFGLLFVLIPRSIPDLLTEGILHTGAGSHTRSLWSPLYLDIQTLSEYASFETHGYSNTGLVYVSVVVRLRALINVKFWCRCAQIWRVRYQRTLARVSQCLSGRRFCSRLTYVFIPPLFILYSLFVLIESLLLLIYNGLPIVSFTCLCFKRYVQFVLCKVSKKIDNVFIKVSVTSFVVIVLFIIMYALSIILIDSFVFIATLLNYTLLGVIVNARKLTNYILLAIIFAIYIGKCVTGIVEGYNQLFIMVVEASITLDTMRHDFVADWNKKSELVVNMTTQTVMPPISHLQINGQHFNAMTEEQWDPSALQTIDGAEYLSSHNKRFGYVRNCGSNTAIPERLFRHVIEKHRPLRNIVMTSVIKLTLTSLVAFCCIGIILTFHRGTELEYILQIAAIVLTGLVPLLLNVFQSPVSQRRRELKFREDLLRTVLMFWKEDMSIIVN